MTLDKLCGLTLDEIDKMTDAQLDTHFTPMFTVTRPTKESIEKAKQALKGEDDKTNKRMSAGRAKRDALKLAKSMGLNLGI